MPTRPTTRLSSSDATLIDLLRLESRVGIAELARALGVTATAVRQRLERLITLGLVERSTAGPLPERQRGRPAHTYSLTAAGRRSGGDNFRDLALVLWRQLRAISDPEVRRGLLSRMGSDLAATYRPQVASPTLPGRLTEFAAVLQARDVACSVGEAEGLHVLTASSCPYPELAEEDRAICAVERLALQDLVGGTVVLSECRLDGDACCRFTVRPPTPQRSASGEVPGP